MLFGGNMIRTDNLVIPSYMVPLLMISGHYDVISKKIQKLLILWFLVSEFFFVTNMCLKLSVLYLIQNDGSHDHFHLINSKMTNLTTLLANLFQLPVWWSLCLEMIIFEISAFCGFNLMYRTWYKLIIHRESSKKL